MTAGPAEPPRPPKGPAGSTPAGDGPAARQSRRNGALLPTVIIVVALIAAFVAFTQVYTEILWFDQLGYLNVFATQNIARAGLFLVAAPEGLTALDARHPDVEVYTASIDERLNEKVYILPGLGDAGDRIFGTRME